MAKRLLCVMLAAMMLFAFTACNEETAPDPAPPVDSPPSPADPEIPADPTEPGGESTEEPGDETAPEVIIDNSGYTGPWPDFNDYVPFSYDMNRVVYASAFGDGDEFCTCEESKECGGDNLCQDGAAIWRRRWNPDASIRPLVGDERIETTIHEFYGDMVLTLCFDNFVTGNSSMLVDNRGHNWAGATLDITDFLPDNETMYEAFAWVKIPEGSDPGRILLSSQTNGLDGEEYRQWADFDAEEGILSKYRLPVSAANALADDPEAWDSRFPEDYVRDDGWVLVRGTTQFVKMFYEKIQIYFETADGHPNQQPIYIDSLTILIAE
ncbi:MAG: hypothetical protein LBC86_07790 [Oscillospiraceae bacterium]|nr:hypothetical protein [Oscillospiraceae bacterium]